MYSRNDLYGGLMNIKLNFWIDVATFTGFMIAMEPHSTGITIHEWFTVAAVGTLIVHFVPALGFQVGARYGWRRIHSLAANLTLVLVAIHVALRWEWVKAAFLRLI